MFDPLKYPTVQLIKGAYDNFNIGACQIVDIGGAHTPAREMCI
jgi:hypothetical protein